MPDGCVAFFWVALLAGLPALIALGLGAGWSAQVVLLVVLALIWLVSLVLLKKDLGRVKVKLKFRDMFFKSWVINILLVVWLFVVLGFSGAVLVMVVVLALIWLVSLVLLKKDLGRVKVKLKFRDMFFKSWVINIFLVVWLFLFGVCDVWFVVVLLVYLSTGIVTGKQIGRAHV